LVETVAVNPGSFSIGRIPEFLSDRMREKLGFGNPR